MISNKLDKFLIFLGLLPFVIVLVIFFSTNVFSLELSPYIGIDGQINRMRFKEGFGNNLFPKHYPQINIYAGLKTNNGCAIEIGHISEAVRRKNSTVLEGDAALGAIITPSLSPALFNSYIKVGGYHLSFLKSYRFKNHENFRMLGGIGLAFLKAEAQRDCVSVGFPSVAGYKRNFKKHKAVLRFLLGSEYKFKNNIGIRGSLCFLNTSTMAIKAEKISGRYTPVIRPKDSFVYSLGVFYEF